MHHDPVAQIASPQAVGYIDSLHERSHLVYAAFMQLSRLFGTTSESETHASTRHFFRWLTTDMLVLISTRIRVLSVYRQLSKVEPRHSCSSSVSLIDQIERIENQIQDAVTHPCLRGIRLHVRTELSALHRLLSAQHHMAQHLFRETTLDLYLCRKTLDTWHYDSALLLESKGTPHTPKLFSWLSTFHKALLHKSNLYFHKTLLRLDFKRELKTLLDKEASYPHLIEQFCQNTQCAYFCLIREPSSCDEFTKKTRNPTQDDYTHAAALPVKKKPGPPATGIHSWRIVYMHHRSNVPGDASLDKTVAEKERQLIDEHWPNVVSLIQYHYELLDQYEKKSVQEPDHRLGITYFLTKVEQNFYIMLLYNRIRQCEPLITEFLNRIVHALQNKHLIQKLDNGNLP
ncbi:KICSTOR subunit 2-like [Schistocerca gregaria]|uniref:KICSTOR subunit 2-like n=1 Tax=Schistocerca gregaria TaxID=7010 RepID=UPI00211DAE0C|nr:KICSTOR subunit 2-like [Schistocerca gregaria]